MYADELLFGINKCDPSRDFPDPKSKHKPENARYGSSEESSGDEIPFKKRKERRRSNTSKTFVETLTKAKSSTFSCVSDMVVRNETIQIKLNILPGTIYDVKISENPSCSSSYFSNPRKTKHVYIHIVWILLNKFTLKDNNEILAQLPYSKHELTNKFTQLGNTPSSSSTSSPSTSSSSATLTAAEIKRKNWPEFFSG